MTCKDTRELIQIVLHNSPMHVPMHIRLCGLARQMLSATAHVLRQMVSGPTRVGFCVYTKMLHVYTHRRRFGDVYTHFRRFPSFRAELCIHNVCVVYAQAVDWLQSEHQLCMHQMLFRCIHIFLVLRRFRVVLCIHNLCVVYARAVDWLHSAYTSCVCTKCCSGVYTFPSISR